MQEVGCSTGLRDKKGAIIKTGDFVSRIECLVGDSRQSPNFGYVEMGIVELHDGQFVVRCEHTNRYGKPTFYSLSHGQSKKFEVK